VAVPSRRQPARCAASPALCARHVRPTMGTVTTSSAAEPEGGDPACWLRRVCPACGRLAEEDPPTRCPACGELLPAE
jgi:rubrerythrin